MRWCVGSSASGSWHVAAERDHASPGVRKECDAGEGRPRGATRAERSIFTAHGPHSAGSTGSPFGTRCILSAGVSPILSAGVSQRPLWLCTSSAGRLRHVYGTCPPRTRLARSGRRGPIAQPTPGAPYASQHGCGAPFVRQHWCLVQSANSAPQLGTFQTVYFSFRINAPYGVWLNLSPSRDFAPKNTAHAWTDGPLPATFTVP